MARIAGTAGERRTLSLNLIVPLLRDGAETTLALNCPRATSSSLALTVDSPITEVRTNSGAVTSKKSNSDGGTRIEVAGPSGQFRLTWQAASTETASVTSVLNAVGAIHVTIDGRGVRSDARLTVRSFGGTFDQFRVRLPRGAKLIRDPAATGSQDPKYRISEEPQTPGPSESRRQCRPNRPRRIKGKTARPGRRRSIDRAIGPRCDPKPSSSPDSKCLAPFANLATSP